MFVDRMETYQGQLLRAEMAQAAAIRLRQELESTLQELEDENSVLAKSSQALKKLLEDMAKENLESIDKVITEGLRRVFYDQQDLTFKSELVDSRNQLQINFRTLQGAASGKAMDSFGASVTVVESLLLRILVVLKMGLAPVLLLDESLAQVSDHYVEPLGRLLSSLCKNLGLTVLLVTHQQGFQESADIVYRADAREDGKVRTLLLKKVKDNGNSGSG